MCLWCILLAGYVVYTTSLQRIKELEAKRGESLRLRVSVDPGGCDGFQYGYKLEGKEESLGHSDQTFEREGSLVVVDEDSMEFLTGATVDFVEEIARNAFAVINNPNSESACGCGQSFAVKNFAENPAFD